mmetsp:Transcript_19260/g.54969  ORF Transcript_19260/g.54969 Transcript_19260/m.54969 type:complete len:442 (-) Transcript_19260:952-2277(-)
MVAKSSSMRIMSAACLATSVPAMPIATPIEACWSAGASLTPSPVIAVTSPCASASSLMMRCLSAGAVLQNTPSPADGASRSLRRPSASAESSAKNALPSQARSSLSRIPNSFPMATAVSLLSPVIMKTLTPADLHRAIARFASGRGGSRMPATPSRIRSDSNASWAAGPPRSTSSHAVTSFVASARHLKGRDAIAVTFSMSADRVDSSNETTDPSSRRTRVHRAMTESGAPLTYNDVASPRVQTVDMDLRPLSNSNVAFRSKAWRQDSAARCQAPACSYPAGFRNGGGPSFSARTRNAHSVGSPTRTNSPESSSLANCASLHSAQTDAHCNNRTSAQPLRSSKPRTSPSVGSYEPPVTSNSSKVPDDGINKETTVIAFVVSVPVLSLQMTDVHPSVSTEGKRLTTTRRAAILLVPRDKHRVITAGNPSGMAATPNATAPLA